MAALIPVRALGVSACPFSVLILFSSFLSIVFKSTLTALFWHHLSNFFSPHSVAFFLLFAWAFCSVSFSCSWPKSELWLHVKTSKFGVFHLKSFVRTSTVLDKKQLDGLLKSPPRSNVWACARNSAGIASFDLKNPACGCNDGCVFLWVRSEIFFLLQWSSSAMIGRKKRNLWHEL